MSVLKEEISKAIIRLDGLTNESVNTPIAEYAKAVLKEAADRIAELEKDNIAARKLLGRIVVEHLQDCHEYLDVLKSAPIEFVDGEPSYGKFSPDRENTNES